MAASPEAARGTLSTSPGCDVGVHEVGRRNAHAERDAVAQQRRNGQQHPVDVVALGAALLALEPVSMRRIAPR